MINYMDNQYEIDSKEMFNHHPVVFHQLLESQDSQHLTGGHHGFCFQKYQEALSSIFSSKSQSEARDPTQIYDKLKTKKIKRKKKCLSRTSTYQQKNDANLDKLQQSSQKLQSIRDQQQMQSQYQQQEYFQYVNRLQTDQIQSKLCPNTLFQQLIPEDQSIQTYLNLQSSSHNKNNQVNFNTQIAPQELDLICQSTVPRSTIAQIDDKLIKRAQIINLQVDFVQKCDDMGKSKRNIFKYFKQYRQCSEKISKQRLQRLNYMNCRQKQIFNQQQFKHSFINQHKSKFSKIINSCIEKQVQKRLKLIQQNNKNDKKLTLLALEPIIILPSIHPGITESNKPKQNKKTSKNVNQQIKTIKTKHIKKIKSNIKLNKQQLYTSKKQQKKQLQLSQSPINAVRYSQNISKQNEPHSSLMMKQNENNLTKYLQKNLFIHDKNQQPLHNKQDQLKNNKLLQFNKQQLGKVVSENNIKISNTSKDQLLKKIQQINYKCQLIQIEKEKHQRKKSLAKKTAITKNIIQENVVQIKKSNTRKTDCQKEKLEKIVQMEGLREVKREDWNNNQKQQHFNRRIQILDRFHYNPFEDHQEDPCQLWNRLMKHELEALQTKLLHKNSNTDSTSLKNGSKYKFSQSKNFIQKYKTNNWIKDEDFKVQSSYSPSHKKDLIDQQIQQQNIISASQITKAFKRRDYLMFNDGRVKIQHKEEEDKKDLDSDFDPDQKNHPLKTERAKTTVHKKIKKENVSNCGINLQKIEQVGNDNQVLANQPMKRSRGRPKNIVKSMKIQHKTKPSTKIQYKTKPSMKIQHMMTPIYQQSQQKNKGQSLFFQDYFN